MGLIREFRTIDTWPWPLTQNRQRARFDTPYSETLALLDRELRHVKATQAYLCLAVGESEIRRDRQGPLSTARPEHPGVMVVTDSKHGDLRYATDVFRNWHDNLRAIALGLEALRKVDRYGVTRGGEQYRGFAALPSPSSNGASHLTFEEAVAVLRRWAGRNEAEVPDVAKVIRLAKINAHPDRHESDHGPWNEVSEAADLVERRFARS